METVFARLLKDFEDGRLNRRQLIQSLAMAATAIAVPGRLAAQNAQQGKRFKALSVDHISYRVTDYKRTRDWYADLMGMTVSNDNGTSQCNLHFGTEGSFIIPRNGRGGRGGQAQAAAAAQPGQPAEAAQPGAPAQPTVTSLVDHIAFKIDAWDTDKVEAELKRRGLAPRLDAPASTKNWASFHVKDPDGWDLQISGDCKPGDRLYKKS